MQPHPTQKDHQQWCRSRSATPHLEAQFADATALVNNPTSHDGVRSLPALITATRRPGVASKAVSQQP